MTLRLRFIRLRADEDDFHLEIDMYSPGILITGRYEGSGGYNSLNISAHGTFVTNISKFFKFNYFIKKTCNLLAASPT